MKNGAWDYGTRPTCSMARLSAWSPRMAASRSWPIVIRKDIGSDHPGIKAPIPRRRRVFEGCLTWTLSDHRLETEEHPACG